VQSPPFSYESILQILLDAGVTQDGTDASGKPYEKGPPTLLATMLSMAASAQASAEDLVGIMTWGQPDLATPGMLDLAERIIALRDMSPA